MSVIDIRQGATQNDRAETSWPEARPAPLPCGAPSSDRFRKLATTAAEMINASIVFVTVLGRNAHSINGRLGFHLRGSAIERVVNLHHLAMGGKLVINDLSKDGRTQNCPASPIFRAFASRRRAHYRRRPHSWDWRSQIAARAPMGSVSTNPPHYPALLLAPRACGTT